MVGALLLTNFNMDADRRLCRLLVGLGDHLPLPEDLPDETIGQLCDYLRHLADDSPWPSTNRSAKDSSSAITSGASNATNSTTTSLTDCASPAANCRCSIPPAVEALYQGSGGLPRQINRIAHYALSAAALAKARTVDAEHMQHALDELRL